MKLLLSIFVLTMALGSVAQAQSDDAAKERAQAVADTRAGLMKVVVAYFGPIIGMARGQAEFDGTVVARNAHKMKELSDMAPDLFRTDTRQFELDTESLPAVWENHEDFLEKMAAMKDAAGALEAAAAEGKDATMMAFQKMGGACKACHDDYRIKK